MCRVTRKNKPKIGLQFQVQEPVDLNELRTRNRTYQRINPKDEYQRYLDAR